MPDSTTNAISESGSGTKGNDAYLAAAHRFAPVVTFYRDGDEGSEERYYPCSIDFLLTHSTLRRGRHDYSRHNTSAPPGLVFFNKQFHIFYRDPHGSGVGHLVSDDGITGWRGAVHEYTGHNTSSGISAVIFYDKASNRDLLHLFYRDETGNGIYHRTSPDGENWSAVQYIGLDCDGKPKAIAAPDCIYVVAVDAGGNGIMYAKSTDGNSFSHDYTGYNTNRWTSPGVAWYRNKFHIFFQDHNGNGVMHITSDTGEGKSWTRPVSWHFGAKTSAGPEVVAVGDKLHLFYRELDRQLHLPPVLSRRRRLVGRGQHRCQL